MEKPGQYLTPFQHKLLLKSLETDLRAEYRRRINIMLLTDAGKSQTEICKTLSCSPEMARYWMDMAQTGRAHLWKERPMGRPKMVSEEYLNRLQELVSHSPREYDYPFQRWTAQWLSKHLAKELGIEVSACHINRLLKQMGLSTRSKPSTEEAPNQSNLAIRDLTSTCAPEYSELWTLNFIR